MGEQTILMWTFYLTEKGHIISFHKKEVSSSFVKEHPHIPRVFYDMNSVAGWEHSYTNPTFCAQFFCDDTDIDIVARCAWDLYRKADKYGLEKEAFRRYLSDMYKNINAAEFLKEEALKRWEWLSDLEYLEDEFKDWEERVDTVLTNGRQ